MSLVDVVATCYRNVGQWHNLTTTLCYRHFEKLRTGKQQAARSFFSQTNPNLISHGLVNQFCVLYIYNVFCTAETGDDTVIYIFLWFTVLGISASTRTAWLNECSKSLVTVTLRIHYLVARIVVIVGCISEFIHRYSLLDMVDDRENKVERRSLPWAFG